MEGFGFRDWVEGFGIGPQFTQRSIPTLSDEGSVGVCASPPELLRHLVLKENLQRILKLLGVGFGVVGF